MYEAERTWWTDDTGSLAWERQAYDVREVDIFDWCLARRYKIGNNANKTNNFLASHASFILLMQTYRVFPRQGFVT